MNKRLWIVQSLVLLALGCNHSSKPAGVEVDGNRLDSTLFPPLTLFVDRAYEYVGGTDFILYEVADARLHVWARPAGGNVRQLYWIQFESYLESNDHKYTYTNSETISVGEFTYYYDPFAMSLDRSKLRRGSDTEKVLDLLGKKGLALGPDVIGIRLVRLDPERRKELMIIYLEDVREHDFAVEDVQQGGALFSRWPQISNQIRKRALAGLEVLAE